MAQGTHDFIDDPRNGSILIYLNGKLVPRAQAMVSVFDSGFVLGDGVWEGLRIVDGHPVFLRRIWIACLRVPRQSRSTLAWIELR